MLLITASFASQFWRMPRPGPRDGAAFDLRMVTSFAEESIGHIVHCFHRYVTLC